MNPQAWARVVWVTRVVVVLGGALFIAAWHPDWREYLAEALVALLVVGAIVAVVRVGATRYPRLRWSPFAAALTPPFRVRRSPPQLIHAAALAAGLGDGSGAEALALLSATAQHRMQTRHGFGLDSGRARVLLGPTTHDLLLNADKRSLSAQDARALLKTLEDL